MLRHLQRLTFVLLLAALFGAPGPGAAQTVAVPGVNPPKADPANDAAKEAPKPLADPLGRETPEGLVTGFVKAVAANDLDRAAQYLDTQSIPEYQRSYNGPQLAAMLQRVLDEAGWFQNRWQLSDKTDGQTDDGLAANLERIGAVRTRTGNVDLLAERITGREPVPIWLVSAATLTRLPQLTRTAVSGPLEQYLPQALSQNRFYGVPIGHWLALVVLVGVAYGLALAASLGIRWAARRVLSRFHLSSLFGLVEAADLPLRLLLAIAVFLVGSFLLGVSIVARQRAATGAEVLAWIALVLLLYRMVDAGARFAAGRAAKYGHFSVLSVVSLLRRTGKVALIAVAAMLCLDSLGVNVTAGLAALGIGGIAIALGAQKTVENFIGSLTIIADAPIAVGDTCKFGDVFGVVEDIGMRSSRIRTLERTVVTVPNSVMAAASIENYSRRDRFWFHPMITLRYETTPDQMRYVLVKIREILYAHPFVSPDPARVRFMGFGADTLNIEIFAYVLTPNFDEFLEVQEDLSLRIMEAVAEAGAAFAFPSRTLYLGRDTKADEAATQRAEEHVRDWASKGELQLPKFTPERIRELRGTIDYASRGPL